MTKKFKCYSCEKENTYKKENKSFGGRMQLLVEEKSPLMNIGRAKNIAVNCSHCGEKNMIKVYG